MYFDDYKNFPSVTLNPKLLWDYDLKYFDYNKMKDVVVQRVVERGWPKDWYFILNRYGITGVRSSIMNIPVDIPLTSLKCYKKKQSAKLHWNS